MALYTAVSESVLSHIVGQNRLHPTAKASYELFGIDYAMTADWGVVCYEINSGPCMKPENRPMLHDMLDIVLPFGYDPQRCAVCRAAPRRRLSQWPCAGSTPKATRASAAGSSSTRPPSARRKRCACACGRKRISLRLLHAVQLAAGVDAAQKLCRDKQAARAQTVLRASEGDKDALQQVGVRDSPYWHGVRNFILQKSSNPVWLAAVPRRRP